MHPQPVPTLPSALAWAALDALSDGILLVGWDGTLRYANEQARQLLHLPDGTGQPLWEQLPIQQYEQLLAAFTTLQESRHQSTCTLVKPGNGQQLLVRLTPQPDGALLQICPDRDAELTQVLRVQDERLQLILAAGQLGIWEWERETNYVQWSSELERIYGLPPGTFNGTLEDALAYTHPEDRDQAQQELEQALAAADTFTSKYRIITPSGEVRWIEVHGTIRRDEQGKVEAVFGTSQHVTSREHRIAALKLVSEVGPLLASSMEYEARLRALAQIVVPYLSDWCSITMLDEHGEQRTLTVAHRDPEKIRFVQEISHRYPPDPNAPRGAPEVLRTGKAELGPEITEEMLIAAAQDAEHLEIIRSIGMRSYMVVPLIVDSKPIGAITMVSAESGRIFTQEDLHLAEDIARRASTLILNARLYEELQQLNAELDQRVRERTAELENALRELESFSYSVSHDLRAPLRSLDGFSLALIEDYGEQLDSTGHDYLRRIRVASQRMAQLIDDLLQLSRVSRKDLQIEPIDLSAIATHIITEIQQQRPERIIDIAIQPGITAYGDLRLLTLALRNLLENAWKFTLNTPNPVIRVELTEQQGQRALTICDNGAGFDMTYINKLFSPFQRLHSETEFQGTGVGLATVQRVIRRHGGTIWAEAEVGKGAKFYVTLPQLTLQRSGPDERTIHPAR